MDSQPKKASDSKAEQVHIVMPSDVNSYNRLFGGTLMQWIDIVAAVVARRHSGMDVTTACVDSLIFLAPAHLGDTILLKGRISYVGNTSMEVNVKTYVEELCGRRSLVNNAHMLMVAVDKSGHPQKVPPLIIKTGAERAEWQAAQTRRELRDKQRI